MSLRRKTLFAIVLTFVGLVIVLFLMSQLIILNQFDQLQSDAIRENVERVQNALGKEMDVLRSTSSDWAYWDDTYQFVQNRNETYIESNLTTDTFKNLQLNFMIYVDRAGKTIYGKAIDFQTDTIVDLPDDLSTQSGLLQPLLTMADREGVQHGIIVSAEGPVLVVSRNILNSAKVGDPQGVLIMGRYLDQAEIESLAQQTQLALNLISVNSTTSSPDFFTAKSTLTSTDAPLVSYDRKPSAAQGYTLLTDINGEPAFILQVETPATIYQAGQRAVFYFLLAMLFVGLVLAIVFVNWIERRLLARMSFLDQRMSEIGNSDDLSARIDVTGEDDELTRLTRTINESLAKREHSQEQKLRALNLALQETNAQLNDKMQSLKQNQNYRDRFFAHASHEFRTPLAIMGTRLYLAKRKPEDWATHIQVLQETQSRLLNIIDDVFDMTKLQENDLTLNMHKTELKSFMPMILEDLSARFQDSNTELSKEFADEDLPVKLDVIYFGKACEKLINFMLDYSQPNNKIIIRMQKQMMDTQPIVSISICSREFHFKPEEITELFSPFYQVSEGKIYTSGLNLSIAKQIISVHEGTLIALNNESSGGCFRITMPIFAKAGLN